jgi:hypothetical protein
MKQETERKQENKKTEPKKRWYDEDLPSLIEADLENSLSHSARKWALDFSNPEHIGEYTWNEYCGLLLQNAGDYRVRCILAIDCFDAKIGLSMYKTTFNAIGVEFELGEFTIVAPDRREDQAASEEVKVAEAPGMEVV